MRANRVQATVCRMGRSGLSTLYVNKRGNKKTMQTIHKPYIQPCILLIYRALRNVQFEAQTIHKLYIEPYIEAFQTLHSERTRNYTRGGTQTLHNGVQSISTGVLYKPSCITLCRSLKSPSLQGGVGVGLRPKKSNNFEPIFSDSTLTFLTYRNTFLLVILPTRRIIFLCLPLI